VLHVLPHPGGGGETYIDLLDGMPGYRLDRLALAASPDTTPLTVARGLAAVARAIPRHDALHVHGEVAAGLCVALLALRPSFVTLHGLNLVRRVDGARRTAARLNLRAILRAANRAICVSESEHAELVHAVGDAAAERATVVRNGVRIEPEVSPSERLAVRESLGLGPSDPVAIWVGSLAENKAPLSAVRAAEDASIALLMVGDGPLRSDVERAASEQTRVLGHRSDVPRLLASADVFILTSQHEGLSFSLLEAMAHGLAPVVTDLPENREAIGEAGIAVRTGDGSLSSALRRLAEHPGERAQLGEQARQRVAKLFTASEMQRTTRALYDEVLTRRRSAASGGTAL